MEFILGFLLAGLVFTIFESPVEREERIREARFKQLEKFKQRRTDD